MCPYEGDFEGVRQRWGWNKTSAPMTRYPAARHARIDAALPPHIAAAGAHQLVELLLRLLPGLLILLQLLSELLNLLLLRCNRVLQRLNVSRSDSRLRRHSWGTAFLLSRGRRPGLSP